MKIIKLYIYALWYWYGNKYILPPKKPSKFTYEEMDNIIRKWYLPVIAESIFKPGPFEKWFRKIQFHKEIDEVLEKWGA